MRARTMKMGGVFLAMALATLACSLGGNTGGTPTPAISVEDQASTAVAATLTAMAPGGEPAGGSETITETPTPEPAVPVVYTERVTYVDHNRNLWVWTDGGVTQQLTASGDVEDSWISPDGSRVVFSRTADYVTYSLWVIQTDGTGERQLISSADFLSIPHPAEAVGLAPYQVDWVNLTTLAMSTSPKYEGPGLALSEDLWMVNVDTGTRTNLLASGSGGAFYFSPDGTKLAIVKPTSISVANADGTNYRSDVMTFPFINTASEYAYYPEPVWSADSTSMRVIIPPQEPFNDPPASGSIWQIAGDGSSASKLMDIPMQYMSGFGISPDLNRAATLQRVGAAADNNYNVLITEISSGAQTVYATGHYAFETWSPDSSHFVFSSHDPSATYLGQVGSGFSYLAETANAMSFKWIAADRYVMLVRGAAAFELRTGTLGSASVLIASFPTGSSFPSFSVMK